MPQMPQLVQQPITPRPMPPMKPMLSFEYVLRDFTKGKTLPVDEIRADLKTYGICVIKLYEEDDPIMIEYAEGMGALALKLRPDGGTPNGANGMGGPTKGYGAACDPAAAASRLDDRAREVHAGTYGLQPHQVMSGWDAVPILGNDAGRKTFPKFEYENSKTNFEKQSNSTLQPHVDVGIDTYGSKTQERMMQLHPIFGNCIQSQLVCKSIPRGGASLVIAPGEYYNKPVDPNLFETGKGRDFCIATPAGYDKFRDQWRVVDSVKRGCLVCWLSATPHTTKRADLGVDPSRLGIYISWQYRELVPEDKRAALKKRKLDAVMSGGSTDHWSSQAPRIHRGSHYSNGKRLTNVIYSKDCPPEYSEELTKKIDAAF